VVQDTPAVDIGNPDRDAGYIIEPGIEAVDDGLVPVSVTKEGMESPLVDR